MINRRTAGWCLLKIDHAAAAEKNGLKLRPRKVIVYGNPKIGTASMQKALTVAIDVPLKALVWEDDQGKVWLTYNSSRVYSELGISPPWAAVESGCRKSSGQ